MSIERELLKRFMIELTTEEDVVSLFNDIKECLAQPEQDNIQYLLDQVARLTAENAMLKEKWSAPKQPEQEPTAWMWEDKRNETNSWATVFSPVKPDNSVHVKNVVLLYTKEKLEDINGISLRDNFAGLAMQGFLSLNKFNTDMIVKLSYDMADAMLAERDKKYDNI